jgi:hypothetical protein
MLLRYDGYGAGTHRRPAPQHAPVGEATRLRWEQERLRPHALHSDGTVCRCAVRWRQQTLARGINRHELWEEPADLSP